MPITSIGGKRVFETGTVLLTSNQREFDLEVANLALTIKISGNASQPMIKEGARIEVKLPDIQPGAGRIWAERFKVGSAAYAISLCVNGIGSVQDRAFSLQYTVTA